MDSEILECDMKGKVHDDWEEDELIQEKGEN